LRHLVTDHPPLSHNFILQVVNPEPPSALLKHLVLVLPMVPAYAAAAPRLASDAAPDDDLVVLLPSLGFRV
jgi:hypothetical protein